MEWMPPKLKELAEQTSEHAARIGAKLAVAESCTGGLLFATLTELPGSSRVVDRGWCTYSNDAKEEELGVPRDALLTQGAVSPSVVEAMALGALTRSRAHFALSISGVAGPDGGTIAKPVGLVYLGLAKRAFGSEHTVAHKRLMLDANMGRTEIRLTTVYEALLWLDMTMPEALGT
ncbi:MAG: CinA family protein [Alphaproteobacteria bacterium]